MTIFDAIIIYLAIGSAFGAHRYFREQDVPYRHRIAAALYHFVFWIPNLIRSFGKSLLADRTVSQKANAGSAEPLKTNLRIEQIRTEIETLLTKNGNPVSIFDLREVLDRYVGLHSLSEFDENSMSASVPKETIFELAGHNNSETAVRCVNRRNRNRISFHQRIAANDFLDLINKISGGDVHQHRLLELSHELAVLINDADTADELLASFSGSRDLQQWNDQPHMIRHEPTESSLRM